MTQLIRALLADTYRSLRGHDLVLTSAGATLYGALAVVPSLLVAIAVAQLVLGRDEVARYGELLSVTLPSAMGAVDAARGVLQAGQALSPLGVAFAVVMSLLWLWVLARGGPGWVRLHLVGADAGGGRDGGRGSGRRRGLGHPAPRRRPR